VALDKYERLADEMRVTCPNCGNPSKLLQSGRWVVWPKVDYDLAPKLNGHVLLEVWTCAVCDRSSLYLQVFRASTEFDRAPTETLLAWPRRTPRALNAVAPDEVRSLFSEASVAEYAGALRGAAGLYRAAVEAMLKDLSIEARTLYDRIEALRARGVGDDVMSDLHEARMLGNDSLHDGLVYSPEEVSDVAQLIEDVVEGLYVEPAHRTAMRDAREARRSGKQQSQSDKPS
jgi:Domain of unknown function (DUF4145)